MTRICPYHILSALAILWAGYAAFDGATDGAVAILLCTALANVIYILDTIQRPSK